MEKIPDEIKKKIEQIENELCRLYLIEGLANGASKAQGACWLLTDAITKSYSLSSEEINRLKEEIRNYEVLKNYLVNSKKKLESELESARKEKGMRWYRCKDKTPDEPNAAYRQLWTNPHDAKHSEWMYFNGKVTEYDTIEDIDSTVVVDQEIVEWLSESDQSTPEKQIQKQRLIDTMKADEESGLYDISTQRKNEELMEEVGKLRECLKNLKTQIEQQNLFLNDSEWYEIDLLINPNKKEE